MKAALAFVLLASTGSTALGQAAGTTQGMSCGQASALVASRGAIVLHTGPNTYDRFVTNSGACPLGQYTEPAWVRTADRAQCFIGYRCRDTDLDNGR
jgi:hypothetical protein